MNLTINVKSALVIWTKLKLAKSSTSMKFNQHLVLHLMHQQHQLIRKRKTKLSLQIQWLLEQIRKLKNKLNELPLKATKNKSEKDKWDIRNERKEENLSFSKKCGDVIWKNVFYALSITNNLDETRSYPKANQSKEKCYFGVT